MPFEKGHKKIGGRKKGSANATTLSVKAALCAAFDEIGGVAALVKWGKKNPALFYPLWGKLLPTELKVRDDGGSGSGPRTIELVVQLAAIFAAEQPGGSENTRLSGSGARTLEAATGAASASVPQFGG